MTTDSALNLYCDFLTKFKNNLFSLILDPHLNCVFFNAKYPIEAQKFIGKQFTSAVIDRPFLDKKLELLNKLLIDRQPIDIILTDKSRTNEYKIKKATFIPIIDNETNEIIAIEIDSQYLKFLPNISIIDENHNNISDLIIIQLTSKFSNRELEIIFLKTIGKTDFEISEILEKIQGKKISHKTINNILQQQIYPKLNVNSKKTMLIKTRQLGFDKFIPNSLVSHDRLIILTHE